MGWMQNGAALYDRTVRPWWRERLLFAALLLALASALVPALFPSGSLMSRLHGSAFDPTTSTVTLRVRSESERAAVVRAADPQGGAQAPQRPLALPAAPALETARTAQVHPVARARPAPALSARPRPAGTSLPRAPPA